MDKQNNSRRSPLVFGDFGYSSSFEIAGAWRARATGSPQDTWSQEWGSLGGFNCWVEPWIKAGPLQGREIKQCYWRRSPVGHSPIPLYWPSNPSAMSRQCIAVPDTGPHPNPTAREIKSGCPAHGHGILITGNQIRVSGTQWRSRVQRPPWIAQTGRVGVACAMISSSS